MCNCPLLRSLSSCGREHKTQHQRVVSGPELHDCIAVNRSKLDVRPLERNDVHFWCSSAENVDTSCANPLESSFVGYRYIWCNYTSFSRVCAFDCVLLQQKLYYFSVGLPSWVGGGASGDLVKRCVFGGDACFTLKSTNPNHPPPEPRVTLCSETAFRRYSLIHNGIAIIICRVWIHYLVLGEKYQSSDDDVDVVPYAYVMVQIRHLAEQKQYVIRNMFYRIESY